ncbi:hypothetical protein QCD60_10460 [Pokkaliibacter sp. MBI-7]|uniref:GNAT family N-acetyltransferase n=1 Tax=Pokkaliibacter sp. MBI-7 TaxID=3040600 RepID=UPI00244A9BA0|nr:hypothetical protein [Pokkaliibacter sp. MBI-7]MDH2432989.1 hypothetical protein [Pokkaliibacter sp. MBI-7]
MTLLSLLKKSYQKGLFGTVRFVFQRFILQRWQLVWLERSLTMPMPARIIWPGEHVRLSASTLTVLSRHFPRHITVAEDFLSNGLHGYAAVDEQGDAIAFAWVADGDYYDPHLYHCWLRVPTDAVYLVYGEVAKKLRGSGLALLLHYVFADCHQRGYQRAQAVVDLSNIRSLTFCLGIGFHETELMQQVYCLAHRFYFSRRQPYQGQRFAHLIKPTRKRALSACAAADDSGAPSQ